MSDEVLEAPDLSRASREWKSSLIDVSGTNRLLHFKATSTTLDLTTASEAAVFRLLSTLR